MNSTKAGSVIDLLYNKRKESTYYVICRPLL